MTTLEILTKARGMLARKGMWIRGWGNVPAGGDGRTCAVGAVKVAAGLRTGASSWNSEARDAANALAAVIGGYEAGAVIKYNDRSSKQCVLTMFDAAIEREERKETK